MKEKIILGTTVFILTATLIFIFGGIVIKLTNQPKFIAPLGQATSGIPSTLAIATTTAVGPQVNKTIFSANSLCTARVIGTAGSAVMITLGDPVNGDVSSTTLTSMVGFTQTASTTIVYDSGIYGCGRWSAYGIASSTITTTEMR